MDVRDTHLETTEKPQRPPAVAWFRDLSIAVIISMVIIFFLYQPVRVEGTSMLPILSDQDRLVINKMAYHIGDIHRGDVVVFDYPYDRTKKYIKRVIALPGDRIRIERGRVFVNDVEMDEKYVPKSYRDSRSLPEQTMLPNAYFMMGDHRSISSDSRDFGPVDRDLITGRASFVYWPFSDSGVVK